MYTLPSRDRVVQTCRGVGQVLLYYVQNVWEWGGWCGISLIYPYHHVRPEDGLIEKGRNMLSIF